MTGQARLGALPFISLEAGWSGVTAGGKRPVEQPGGRGNATPGSETAGNRSRLAKRVSARETGHRTGGPGTRKRLAREQSFALVAQAACPGRGCTKMRRKANPREAQRSQDSTPGRCRQPRLHSRKRL